MPKRAIRRNPLRRRVYRKRHRSNPLMHNRRRRSPRRNPVFSTHTRRKIRHFFRRRYRRNPPMIAGLDLKQLLIGGTAIIVSPLLEKQLLPLLPTSVSGTTYGRYAVKIGSGLAIWYVANKALGRSASDVVAIALGASIVAEAAQEFMPSLTGMSMWRPAVGMGAFVPRRGLGLVRSGQLARPRGLGQSAGVAEAVRIGPARYSLASGGDVFSPPF